MALHFNTSGPCFPEDHYMIPYEDRLGPLLSQLQRLFDEEKYFIFHAPRQTGKTTLMMELAKKVTEQGDYIGLYVNIEPAQALGNNVEGTNRAIIGSIKFAIKGALPKTYHPSPNCYQIDEWENGFQTFLQDWCLELSKPLVLLIDEVDALIGDGLLSILRQLRSGYNYRPSSFPKAVALIGVRDVRDYRIYSKEKQGYILGGSAFNIKETSIKLSYFSKEDVIALFKQHTNATGQAMESDALEAIYEQTLGQPWLVNALGRELFFGENPIVVNEPLQKHHVMEAREVLIKRRDVHLDQLIDKLTEKRVANIIQPLLLGKEARHNISDEDLQYVIELGLCRRGDHGIEIANPIYREIIPRALTNSDEHMLPENPADYVKSDGRLDMERLLERLIAFYRRNHAMITSRKTYTEAAHHLIFLAWLHRIVNSGGTIEREYALGLGRMDLLIRYADQSFALELKLMSKYALEEGKQQLCTYLTRLGLGEGYLVIFNRQVKDEEAIGRYELIEYEGKKITVIWM